MIWSYNLILLRNCIFMIICICGIRIGMWISTLVGMSKHALVCSSVEKRIWGWISFFLDPHHIYWGRAFHLNPDINNLSFLVNLPFQVNPVFITKHKHYRKAFKIQTWVLIFHAKLFTLWAISLAPSSSYFNSTIENAIIM